MNRITLKQGMLIEIDYRGYEGPSSSHSLSYDSQTLQFIVTKEIGKVGWISPVESTLVELYNIKELKFETEWQEVIDFKYAQGSLRILHDPNTEE